MPRWSLILTIWLLVFAVVGARSQYPLIRTVVLIDSSDLASFRNPNVSYYSNLLVRNGWLYATGTSHVLRLSAARIDDRTKNAFNYINTTTSKTSEADSKRNFITFLSPRPRLNDLVICGTNLGKPHIYDLSEADLSYQFEHDGSYLCPGLEGFASLGLIGHESQLGKRQMAGHGVMFSAIWITDEPSDKYSIFSRYGIFRKNMEVNDQFARTLFSPSWLWEPEFVSIMEDDSFVYFLFNEVSIEEFSLKYPNFSLKSIKQIAETPRKELKRVPRIARICKNDRAYSDRTRPHLSNMWTTFRKVKLRCDCRGFFEAPELKHLETRDFDELSATLELPHSKRLIGVFHDNDSTKHSAICEFDIDDVRDALSSKKFWLSTNHAGVNEENFKYFINDIGCDSDESSEQDPAKELNDEAIDESLNPARTDQSFAKISRAFPNLNKEDVNGYYEFLAENTILNRVVQGQCKFILPHEIVSMSLNENGTAGRTDIFLALSSSRIIKLVRNSGNGSSFYEYLLDLNLNITKPDSDEPNPTAILFSQKTNSLYVANRDAIHQLNFELLTAKMCSAYKTCQECARDDNCAWSKRDSKCAESKSRGTPDEPCGAEFSASPSTIREVNGFVNETLVLKCDTRAAANDLIVQRSLFWIRDGESLEVDWSRRIVSRQSDLIIVKLETSDQGLYQCKSGLDDVSNEGVIRVRVLERAPSKCPNDVAQNHSDLVRLVSMIKLLSEKIKQLNDRLETLDCS